MAFPDNKDAPREWYYGACHCHAVEYKVHLPDIYSAAPPNGPNSAAICNCSICLKNGYILVYPERSELVWLKGEDTLKGYKFASKRTTQKFCPNCGSSILNDPHGLFPGRDALVLNARMLKGMDPDKMTAVARRVDGRNLLGPEYNEQTA